MFEGDRMNRRDFLLAGAMLVLVPVARQAKAQQSIVKKRMASVTTTTKLENIRNDQNFRVLFDELKQLGYVEGENLTVDL
jgi:hypothetical protein